MGKLIKRYYDEMKLIKDTYDNIGISVSDSLLNKTLNRCNDLPRKHKKYRSIYSIGALAASLIIILTTIYIHMNIRDGFSFNNSNQCKSNNSTTPGCTYVTQSPSGDIPSKADIIIKGFIAPIYDTGNIYITIDSLKNSASDVVMCEITEMKTEVIEKKGKNVPVTHYTMKILDVYSGEFKKGDTFKLTKPGGIFNYEYIYKLFNLSQSGYTLNSENKNMNADILSYENAPNYNLGDQFIIFLTKDSSNDYAIVGDNDGLFKIENSYLSRFVGEDLKDIKPNYNMPVNDFIRLLNN